MVIYSASTVSQIYWMLICQQSKPTCLVIQIVFLPIHCLAHSCTACGFHVNLYFILWNHSHMETGCRAGCRPLEYRPSRDKDFLNFTVVRYLQKLSLSLFLCESHCYQIIVSLNVDNS